ncbi:MAG: Ig-like domain-containing protein, partial [Candidatus Marinimicrobia bacterium]|nr:Ig-like domain-containing protein [Candidatus Neomarinimicrobiota bacterium]
MTITLNFSEPVYTSGSMRVTFETGDSDSYVDISSWGIGSITSAKSFTYTVSEGDETGALTIKSIAMNSGQILDRGNNALSNFNLSQNLDATSSFNIDGVRPTITTITTDKADGTYGLGTEITVTSTFSEAVTLSGGNFVMTLETGDTDRDVTISSISASTTTSGIYTVQSGDVSNDLNATVNASTSGTLKDGAGNAMSNFGYGSNFAGKSIVVETTPPTISNVTSTTNNGTYGVGDDINVTVTFSEDVTLSGSGAVFTVPLETGSTNLDYDLEISSISSAGTGSGTYTVRANDDTGGSDLTVKTTPGLTTTGTVADDAGNIMADFTIPGGQNLSDLKNIKIDAVYPTITSITSSSADGTYKIGDDVNITINFSEDMTLAGGTLDITLNHGNTDNVKVSINNFGPASTASGTYTVAATDTTNDLNHTLVAVSAGATLGDAGGNSIQSWSPATELATNKALVIDGNRPTIMKIRSSKAAGYYKIGDVIPIQIYFTEAVTTSAANIVTATLETGSTNADATVTYGAISNATIASADYTVRAGDYNSSLTLNSIAISVGQSVDDQAGNAMTDTSIPTGKNLADEIVDIFVDGVVPVDPGTEITMASTGGNVVPDKYNDTNTGVDFTVAIQSSDASLVGGTIQIKAKIAPNGWESIGDAHTITDANKTGGSATISVLSAPIEALTGFATDAEIKIKATVTDVAGNATDWAESTNSLTVDVTRPTITSATSTTDAGLYNTADAINTTLGFSEVVTLSGGDLTITLNTIGTSTVAESDLSNSNSASATYTVASGESTADKTPAMLTVSNVNVTAGELKDAAGNPMVFPVTSIASNIADIKTIEVDGIDPTKMAIQSVKTVTDTIRAGYWNGGNTAVKVRVGLDKNDASLAGGTIQVTAQISGSFENIGTAATIVQDSVAIEYQTIEIANSITGGTKGLEEISNFQDLSTINFKAVVTDKAGNATNYDAASTTLIVDQTDPTAFTTDSVITVTDEIVYGYWNEDNTAINVQVPIENDATLENGTVQVQAEADGAFEFIGAGSLNSTPTAITSSDLGTEKIITITGPSTLATIKELEELSGFGDTDIITFRAIIVDVAGNSTVGGLSPTEMTVDQTDPGAPIIALKTDSDTGIANWDKLTNDDTPTFTITNVNNTDSVFIKVATDAATLALNSSIVTRDKSASSSIDLTSTSQANGTYLVTAGLKDIAGNWSTDATNTFVRIDTIPPDVPNAPDLLEDDDTGFNNKDNITKKAQPHFIFTGLSSTIDSLRLVIDAGRAVGRDSIMSQVTTDTFKVRTALNSGYHTAGVIAIDSAGNAQNISALLPFVVDNVAPPIPTAPDMTAATDSGMSDTDNITKIQKPNFNITNIELGSFINLYHVDATPDTMLADSDTIGVGVTTTTSIPVINMADGTYTMYATAEDTAGNISESNDLSNVIIDATVPTIIANYHNKTIQTVYNSFTNKFKNDSIRVGKGGDEVEFIATMSEPAGTNPEPTLDVTYGNSATPAVDGMPKTKKANNDTTWFWKITLPTGENNNGAAKVVFTASDVAGNLAVTFTDTQKFTVDNTPPAAFTTGLASALGDTNVSMVVESKTGWFINNTTDSIKVLTPISTTDNSLVNGGYVDIQARVRNKMVNTWATVNSNVVTNPFFPQDSTESLGASIPLYRKKLDITTALTGNGLLQGDTVDVRAMIYDIALNSTAGTQSESFFVLDTLPPTIGTFITDTLYTLNGKTTRLRVNQDTTWTNDTISFAIKDWVDPGSQTEKSSGIHRYEYALYQSATDANSNYSPFRDFKNQTNLLDSVFIDTFALTHDRNYYVRVRGVDVAGNTSLTNGDNSKSDYVLRHNARPEVEEIIDELIAKEDVLLEQLLTVNDKDLLTLRFDKFTYSLTTIKLDTTQTPIDSSVVTNLNASVSASGKISFTPTKLDTGKYVFTTIIYDNWKNSKSPAGLNFADTSNINIRVLPVNDPPILDLSSIAKLNFLEGANSDSINLTRYVYDEDDDTSSIDFSFRIASILPAN